MPMQVHAVGAIDRLLLKCLPRCHHAWQRRWCGRCHVAFCLFWATSLGLYYLSYNIYIASHNKIQDIIVKPKMNEIYMFTLDCLHKAQAEIYAHMPATPQYSWPLLNERMGKEVWIKHENHTPTGAFKVRGGLLYMARLKASGFKGGLVTATRGNHGQSLALASKLMGIPVTIVVPKGNSVEKNAAMQALGAELVVKGADFDEARAYAAHLSKTLGLQSVPSFHPDLVVGVATYAYEFFKSTADLDKVYVPIGMGSGICGMIKTRDLLGLKTKVIGVVSENAPAYALSLAKGEIVQTETANTFADGVACRQPDPLAFEMVKQGVDHIVQVSDDEIKDAIRAYYKDTHNLAEGAGAVGLAGLMQEVKNGGCDADTRIATVLSGGNIDMDMFEDIIQVCRDRLCVF